MAAKDSGAGSPVRDKKEVREEIRDYIRNERDTVLKKWMALKESLDSEDRCRDAFYRRKFKEDTKSLPVNILKFIGTLKKSVRKTMRYKGGTPYSIVRSMFIYWDADKSGSIDAQELLACMKSLGVKVSLQDCADIVRYYRPPNHAGDQMDYLELLNDIQAGEPSVIAFVSQQEDDERDQQQIRFEEVSDKFVQMPDTVQRFIEAVRNYLLITMRRVGGTPHEHVRELFYSFDFDYSNGLDPKELSTACRRKMKLNITEAQARSIVEYYDRKQEGQIHYEKFLDDVCVDVKPILTFPELTPRRIENAKRSLAANPFIPKPFKAPHNKTLEKFKEQIKAALVDKLRNVGGTVVTWLREAFVTWDRNLTGKITSSLHLVGAAKRLGVTITDDEAQTILRCYDIDKSGQMDYEAFMKDMQKEDAHFLSDAKALRPEPSVTHRTPAHANHFMEKIRRAVDSKFVQKSKGKLDGRDILHGTFLRFDTAKSGQLDLENFMRALEELRLTFREGEAADLVKWFDTAGNNCVDYNALCRQLYGSDVTNERLNLPRIREPSAYNTFLSTRGLSASSPAFMTATTGNYASVAMTSSIPVPQQFGVKANTMERNLEVIESEQVKNARVKLKRIKILQEKGKVEKRLAAIDEQRKKIIEDYKTKKFSKGSRNSAMLNDTGSNTNLTTTQLLQG